MFHVFQDTFQKSIECKEKKSKKATKQQPHKAINETTRHKFKQFEILGILESILYPTFTHDEVIFHKQVYGS